MSHSQQKADARALLQQLTTALAPPNSNSSPVVSPTENVLNRRSALDTTETISAPAKSPTPPPSTNEQVEIGPVIERRKTAPTKVWIGRIAKTSIAVVILAAVVWAPVRVMLQSASVEAVVNARLVVLRAPIEGRVVADGLPAPGSVLASAQKLMRIENPRVDQQAVQGLEQQLSGLAAERRSLEYKIKKARAMAEDLRTQIEDFRDARITVLNIDIQILDQQISAQEERSRLAKNDAVRADQLRRAGVMAEAATEKAIGGNVFAQAALSELQLQRDRLEVERDALNNGVYVGDSYNDRPQSAQRLDEIVRQLGELEADLVLNRARSNTLAQALEKATAQQRINSEADIVVARSARVWEVLASPGEQVNRGQDLIRLLSCDEAVVTAAVSEGVYNTLYTGMPAAFIPRGSYQEFNGRIVNLTGMAGASSNYAIDPSTLKQEPYRVTVAIPGLASSDGCTIGRTGRVMFGDPALQSTTNSLVTRLRSYFQ